MSRRVLLILSVLCVIISIVSYFRFSRVASPGELVPTKNNMIWRTSIDGHSHASFANLVFPIVNKGGRRVRVLSVESACGCAVPQVEPTILGPHQSGRVVVSARAPELGEKSVQITLNTDSLENPHLYLYFTLISEKRAPYILKVDGDVTFTGAISHRDTREVRVDTIENAGSAVRPTVTSSIAELAIAFRSMSELPYITNGTLHRTYLYDVKLLNDAWASSKSGDIKVVSPWLNTDVHYINTYINPLDAIHVSPAVARFNQDNVVSLVVRSYDPRYELGIRTNPGDRVAYLVDRLPGKASSPTFTVRVSRAGGAKSPVKLMFFNTGTRDAVIFKDHVVTIEPSSD